MEPQRAWMAILLGQILFVQVAKAWVVPSFAPRASHHLLSRTGMSSRLPRGSCAPLRMSTEEAIDQATFMEALTPESAQTIVDHLNRMPKEDLLGYVMNFSKIGEIAKGKNAVTAGSYVVESANVQSLDFMGMEMAVDIRKRSFFGKISTSQETVKVLWPEAEGTLVTAEGIKRRLMKMSRKIGRISSTALIYKIPVGSYSGLPLNLKLNNVPHSKLARTFVYVGAAEAVVAAVQDPDVPRRMQLMCSIPETNISMDTYRIGTVLEMVREVALELAESGYRVKICVQRSMGGDNRKAMPLALSGMMSIMNAMDWAEGNEDKIVFGGVGPNDVQPEDDVFIILAPQSIVGASIHEVLGTMVEAAGNKAVLLVNPVLKDRPSSGGVMSVRGRGERMSFAESFKDVYNYRLVYSSSTSYFPIKGAVMKAGPWEPYVVFEKRDNQNGEEYVPLATFDEDPDGGEITPLFKN